MDEAKKGSKGQNPKPETRNPNETPSPKPQWDVSSSILGFWFWSFIRTSGFGFRVSPHYRPPKLSCTRLPIGAQEMRPFSTFSSFLKDCTPIHRRLSFQ